MSSTGPRPKSVKATALQPAAAHQRDCYEYGLDVVDFFLAQHVYNSIAKKLAEIPEIDSMLYGLSTVQQGDGAGDQKGIDTLLMLKSLIKEVTALADLLERGLESVLASDAALTEDSGALALIHAI